MTDDEVHDAANPRLDDADVAALMPHGHLADSGG